MPVTRTRIAPTPSGRIHLGNLFSFALTWIFARQNNLELLLRVDDFDQNRAKPELVQKLFSDLKRIGISWDHGPKDSTEFYQHYSQSLKKDRYQSFAFKLLESGDAFVCNCSRKEIQKLSPNMVYPGTCRKDHKEYIPGVNTIRLYTGGEFNSSVLKDFVLIRRDGLPSYQLVSLIDDIDSEITHIIRGEDLLESSRAQLLLAEKLNLFKFREVRIYHHQLLRDQEGQKLSKSKGSSLDLDSGLSLSSLLSRLAPELGMRPENRPSEWEEMLSVDVSKFLKLLT